MFLIFGTIGTILSLGPFIALFLDLRKSKAYGVFFLFLGIFIIFFSLLKGLEGIVYPTLFAFCSAPLIFIYIFALGEVDNQDSDHKILDD